jgi:hypothetical protein
MRPRTSIEIDTHIEVKVSVYADYQPYEAETLETPAVEEAIEHITVYRGAYNITKTLDTAQLEHIEEELWESMERDSQLTEAFFEDLDDKLAKLSIRGLNA